MGKLRSLIVGTHTEDEHESKEFRENKEGKLQEIIASFQLEKVLSTLMRHIVE